MPQQLDEPPHETRETCAGFAIRYCTIAVDSKIVTSPSSGVGTRPIGCTLRYSGNASADHRAYGYQLIWQPDEMIYLIWLIWDRAAHHCAVQNPAMLAHVKIVVSAMKQAAIIPHAQIALMPLMTIDVRVLGCVLKQFVE